MGKYNVLILGSGGREHTLAWKISQSDLLNELFIAPGNAGTMEVGKNIEINVNDFKAIAEFCIQRSIHLVLVGPEEPLVKGICNYFELEPSLSEIMIIGPGKEGASLEGSKDFAKQFMNRHNIPTASYGTFSRDTVDQAILFLEKLNPPFVLKADGLAAGKGVIICEELDSAISGLKEMLLGKKFGAASELVVIEEFLKGIELSVFALLDGESYVLLPEAKDYKRVGEGDTGPNTGGMGSVSPVPFADKAFMKKVEDRIIAPTVRGLKSEGIKYCGFIFAGLMNVGGDPYVIEYNVRLGDPETEVVLPRIKSDFLELLILAAKGKVSKYEIQIDDEVAACVMLVSGGYPGDYEKGEEIMIKGSPEGSLLFHAGTTMDESTNKILTSGGRVLAVISKGRTLSSAMEKSYLAIEQIHFDRMFFRRDIGMDLLSK
ncbi:MAG: phosphoribosylamine--glycine ligase [Bacteroidetes bacterium]|nr:phosphoribosylamine--glycine ligase [Bacteroidota bacterium]